MKKWKRCRRCRRIKLITKFYRHRGYSAGVYPECKRCHTKRATKDTRRRAKEDPFVYRVGNWQYQGIDMTKLKYLQLFEQQKSRCAICGRQQKLLSKALAVDHNHKTGQIRGLLCDYCNRMLGFLENVPYRLKKLNAYLSP